MQGGPKPLIEKTQKTYYKGQMILKMPLNSGGGHLYFTKTNKLQVQFFRIVSSNNQINNPFNGYYEFIDMITYKYNKIKFKEGIRQASINTNTSTLNSIQNTSTIKSTETWVGAFFRCLVKHIIAIPRRDKYGVWHCYGIGVESSDPSELDEVNSDLQDGGGGFNWASWFLFLYPQNFYTPNPIPDPSIVWDPYLGGGGGGGYPDGNLGNIFPPNWEQDPNFYNQIDEVIMDFDNLGYEENPNAYYGDDTTDYQIIDTIGQIPTISDVIGPDNFIERKNSDENCFEIAKNQIKIKGYTINGYDPNRTTFQIYKRSNGININEAKKGVSYIVSALKRNIPVVVGVDYNAVSKNTDQTTNHFVVIVGMSVDASGQLTFYFYDNMTSIKSAGTNKNNTLKYDPNTGSLKGSFSGSPSIPKINYTVSQIRKSIKI